MIVLACSFVKHKESGALISFIVFMGALSLYNSQALLRNGCDEG